MVAFRPDGRRMHPAEITISEVGMKSALRQLGLMEQAGWETTLPGSSRGISST